MKRYKDIKFDKEEQALIDSFENGEMELKSSTKKELESIKKAAFYSFKKQSNPAGSAIRRGR